MSKLVINLQTNLTSDDINKKVKYLKFPSNINFLNCSKIDTKDEYTKVILQKKPNLHISHLPDEEIYTKNEDIPIINDISRLLKENTPELEYKRRKFEFKKSLHWGQLKLMLSEIEFLTLVMKDLYQKSNGDEIVVIYAGSAPGHHIKYLSKLFPDIMFRLYDPRDFIIKECDKIEINQCYFTDEIAMKLKEEYNNKPNANVYFISDIRREPATEKTVEEDMEMQLQWYKIMNPQLTMFKFRLPWQKGVTTYLEGDIYIQVYPGETSTETRLIIPKNAKMVKYDNKKYENQLFYHNFVVRKQKFNNYQLYKEGLCGCYDCECYYQIVKSYLEIMKKDNSHNKIIELINEISSSIQKKKNLYIATVNDIVESLQILSNNICNTKNINFE